MNPENNSTDPEDHDFDRETLNQIAADVEISEENVENAKEEYDDAKDEYKESLSDLKDAEEELDDLLNELDDADPDEIADIQSQIDQKKQEIANRRSRSVQSKDDLERKQKIMDAAKQHLHEAKERYADAKRRFKESAKSKSKEEFTRINFTLPKGMKDEWQKFAEELKVNTSEMIRTAMEGLTQGMKTGNFASLTEWEKSMENLGRDIENTVGKNLKKTISTIKPEPSTENHETELHRSHETHTESAPPSQKRSRMDVMNEMLKLKELLDAGVLNQEEYDELRKRLLKEL